MLPGLGSGNIDYPDAFIPQDTAQPDGLRQIRHQGAAFLFQAPSAGIRNTVVRIQPDRNGEAAACPVPDSIHNYQQRFCSVFKASAEFPFPFKGGKQLSKEIPMAGFDINRVKACFFSHDRMADGLLNQAVDPLVRSRDYIIRIRRLPSRGQGPRDPVPVSRNTAGMGQLQDLVLSETRLFQADPVHFLQERPEIVNPAGAQHHLVRIAFPVFSHRCRLKPDQSRPAAGKPPVSPVYQFRRRSIASAVISFQGLETDPVRDGFSFHLERFPQRRHAFFHRQIHTMVPEHSGKRFRGAHTRNSAFFFSQISLTPFCCWHPILTGVSNAVPGYLDPASVLDRQTAGKGIRIQEFVESRDLTDCDVADPDAASRSVCRSCQSVATPSETFSFIFHVPVHLFVLRGIVHIPCRCSYAAVILKPLPDRKAVLFLRLTAS